MSYSAALPPSFLQAYSLPAGSIPGIDTSSIPLYNIDFNAPLPIDFSEAFSGKFDLSGTLNSTAWTFITAPADISWTTNNAATRVDMFGTNNPPVVSGTKGMRDLRLGNALVEGFGRNVSVQGKVSALENLMNYKLNPTAGFVNVPVYRVKVSKRLYGDDGYFIFKSLTVKETMRDLQGNTTRAYVDIEMMQVPKFQVDSGTDQASTAVANANRGAVAAPEATKTAASTASKTASKSSAKVAKAATQAAKTPAQTTQGVGTTKPRAGAGAPPPPPPLRSEPLFGEGASIPLRSEPLFGEDAPPPLRNEPLF